MTRRNDDGPRPARFQWLRDAFSLEPDYEPLTDEEVALLDRIARFVVKKGLVTPAILFLESVKPLNYVGSQAMAFFEPMVRMLFAGVEYSKLQRILERRESLEVLMQRIEKADAEREAQRRDEVSDEPSSERRETGDDEAVPDDTHEAR